MSSCIEMCPQVCVANKTILNSCLMLAYFVSVTWICESDASGITKIRVPRFFSFMSQTFFKEETHVIFFLFQLYKHLTQSKYWNNFLFVQHPLHTWVDMLSCKILCHVKWSRSKHQIIFCWLLKMSYPINPHKCFVLFFVSWKDISDKFMVITQQLWIWYLRYSNQTKIKEEWCHMKLEGKLT